MDNGVHFGLHLFEDLEVDFFFAFSGFEGSYGLFSAFGICDQDGGRG
jgi:hypothetical protein